MGNFVSTSIKINNSNKSSNNVEVENDEGLWSRISEPPTSPDGAITFQIPNYFLLSSAVEIVTRQRITEQLENLLLNLQSNRENNSQDLNTSSANNNQGERFYHSTPSGELIPRDRQTESSLLNLRSIESSSNNRNLSFTSLYGLFAFLLQNNEIRLKESLQEFTADNLNTMSDDDNPLLEQDDSIPATSRMTSTAKKPTLAMIVPREQAKLFVGRMNEQEMNHLSIRQNSFQNLHADIHERAVWGDLYFAKNINLSNEQASNELLNDVDSRRVGLISALRLRECGAGATNLRRQHICNACAFRDDTSSRNIQGPPQSALAYGDAPVAHRIQAGCAVRGRRRAHVAPLTDAQYVMLNNNFLPNQMKIVDCVNSKTFCVMYRNDGDQLITASQDYLIRCYAMRGNRYRYKIVETLTQMPFLGWSIVDMALSSDNRYLIYATWSDHIYQYDFERPENGWKPIRLYVGPNHLRHAFFSVRFNADGREVVAGASDSHVYVYDREAGACVVNMAAHDGDDINAICFADAAGHLIATGSDDSLCKVWDRRTMGNGSRPVGIFAGHTDGINFIDSRGDDRYILSTSKDQTIKLWDLRHFATDETIRLAIKVVSQHEWNYRYDTPPEERSILRGDCSVATLSGHTIMHTLARARFSPQHTGTRYVYTGSAKGNCVVYDLLTGKIVKVYSGHVGVVRDCVWHPHRNEIITSSWDGSTFMWRHDQRRGDSYSVNESSRHSHNIDSDDDDDSCDENYTPIPKRTLVGSNLTRLRAQQ